VWPRRPGHGVSGDGDEPQHLIVGAKELAGGATRSERVRRPGGGRRKAVELDPELLVVLDSLVEPESRGDPMSALRWTLKSTRTLAGELTRLGHQAGSSLVGRMLHYMGYSLQANAKVSEGAQHVDRDAQFAHINATAVRQLAGLTFVWPIEVPFSRRSDLFTNSSVVSDEDEPWRAHGNQERLMA